jgi:hypothetical protein
MLDPTLPLDLAPLLGAADPLNPSLSSDLGLGQSLNNLALSSQASVTLSASTASGNFASNLPSSYKTFAATMIRPAQPETSVKGGIYGAPLPDTSSDPIAFGNPNTRYAWVYSGLEGIGYPIAGPSAGVPFQIPPSFQLDGDDALVLYGTTPSAYSYLSYTLYTTLVPYNSGSSQYIPGYSWVGASVGNAVNNENIKTNTGSPYNGQFALVVTANTQTFQTVANALVKSGVPQSAINSYLFPSRFADAATSQKPYQLSLLARHTFQSSQEKQTIDEYLKGIPALRSNLNFNGLAIQAYGDQDIKSTTSVSSDGYALQVNGNGWKKVNFSYNITPNTILEFDYRSGAQGEIQGIGFDSDNTISANQIFQLYGTESFGLSQFRNYASSAPGSKHYQIPVGQFYTGQMKYLTFINDQDISNPNAQSLFSNIKIYEQVPNPIVKVAFVKGPGTTGNVTDASLPTWESTLRNYNVEYANNYSGKLDTLQQSVINKFKSQGYTLTEVLTETFSHPDPEEFRTTTPPSFGGYNAADALYTYFTGGLISSPLGSAIRLQNNNSNSLLVAIGVDHTTVGDDSLATYFSYASQAVNLSKAQLFSFAGLYTQGSAQQYLSASQAQDLYAVTIVPSNTFGAGQPYTVNIPFQTGSTADQNQFALVGRLYLDKVTANAPNPANLVPTRILHFEKSSSTISTSTSLKAQLSADSVKAMVIQSPSNFLVTQKSILETSPLRVKLSSSALSIADSEVSEPRKIPSLEIDANFRQLSLPARKIETANSLTARDVAGKALSLVEGEKKQSEGLNALTSQRLYEDSETLLLSPLASNLAWNRLGLTGLTQWADYLSLK